LQFDLIAAVSCSHLFGVDGDGFRDQCGHGSNPDQDQDFLVGKPIGHACRNSSLYLRGLQRAKPANTGGRGDQRGVLASSTDKAFHRIRSIGSFPIGGAMGNEVLQQGCRTGRRRGNPCINPP